MAIIKLFEHLFAKVPTSGVPEVVGSKPGRIGDVHTVAQSENKLIKSLQNYSFIIQKVQPIGFLYYYTNSQGIKLQF